MVKVHGRATYIRDLGCLDGTVIITSNLSDSQGYLHTQELAQKIINKP